jgi:hypothetical protein
MFCFVIMPFGDPAVDRDHFEKMEDIYSEWIKPTVESIALPDGSGQCLQCHRADKAQQSGNIVDHVIESLVKADIVIADLTGRNPNVFYELGIRHAVSNATILIAEGMEHVPFDVRQLRTLIYSYSPPGMNRFRRELKTFVAAAMNEPDRVDNPVRGMLLQRAKNEALSQPAGSDVDVIRSLAAELATLREDLRTQRSEVTNLLRELTKPAAAEASGSDADRLARFEGVWRDGDSVYCVRVIKGELRAAYSYQQGDSLTSHLFNCKVIGDVVLARFQWFESRETRGFVALRMIDHDHLAGGWDFDVPPTAGKGQTGGKQIERPFRTSLSPEDPTLYQLNLRREAGARVPAWAEEYFRRY